MANDTTWDPKEFVPATKKGKNGEGKPAFFAAALKSSEDSRLAFHAGIKEIERSLTVMAAERETIKDIVDAHFEKFDIPKPVIRKVANLYFKKAAAEFEENTEDVKSLYGSLATPSK